MTRSRRRRTDVVILIVDDHADSRWVLAHLVGRELGADLTMRKPIDIDAVRRAVSQLLVA